MSLCPYAYLRVSLSGLLTASDQGSLMTFGELFNVSALDPLLPTLLIATLCLCALLTIFYYSLVVAWEVFWASRQSPSLLDSSAEVVLTRGKNHPGCELVERVWGINKGSRYGLWETGQASASPISHQSVGRTGVYIGLELL